jgi:hypothetical protein
LSNCVACQKLGRQTVAARIVPGKGELCDFHLRYGTAPPLSRVERESPTTPETKGPKQMPNEKQFDETKLRADVEAGLSVSAIAERHGSTWATVKKNLDRLGLETKPTSGKRPEKPAAPPSRRSAPLDSRPEPAATAVAKVEPRAPRAIEGIAAATLIQAPPPARLRAVIVDFSGEGATLCDSLKAALEALR